MLILKGASYTPPAGGNTGGNNGGNTGGNTGGGSNQQPSSGTIDLMSTVAEGLHMNQKIQAGGGAITTIGQSTRACIIHLDLTQYQGRTLKITMQQGGHRCMFLSQTTELLGNPPEGCNSQTWYSEPCEMEIDFNYLSMNLTSDSWEEPMTVYSFFREFKIV